MKLQPAVLENLKKIAILNFVLTVIENAVFFALGQWTVAVLIGSAWGYAVSVLSFWLLGISVQKAMQKEQKAAQAYMQSTYMGRMILSAGAIAVIMITGFGNWFSAVIPLFFTRISITVINLKKKEE